MLLHLGCSTMSSSVSTSAAASVSGSGDAESDMVKLGGPMAAAMLDMAHDLSLRNRFEAVPSRYRQQSLDNLKSCYGYKDLRAWLLSLPE